MKFAKTVLLSSVIGSLIVVSGFAGNDALIKKGEKIFNTKKLANCLACHAVNGKNINNPGSLGPKLAGLANYPDEYLYNKIYNPYTTNPITAMPAFGLNGVLQPSDIKAVVAYLKTVK